MKVIQVPFCFYPDPVGGTEVYVEALVRGLSRRGVQAVVAAPAKRGVSYRHAELEIRRFAISGGVEDVSDLYGEGDVEAARAFGRIVDQEHPDLVHLHAFTSGVSLRLVREVKRKGIAVLFTYHTPTVSCLRGTLMRWGKEACDGRLDLGLCTRCTLHGLGLPRGMADLVGQVPALAGKVLESMRLSGGVWTALRMRELVSMRHACTRALWAEADHVVAVCGWVQDLLVANGVPPAKITLCRQGLAHEVEGDASRVCPRDPAESRSAAIRAAFIGRLDPTKGLHILIQAMRKSPRLPFQLDVYGIVQDSAAGAYRERLGKLVAGDRRVAFRDPLPAKGIVGCLRGYDLLVVPSQWLESGPMVVLEAFAAGIPVLGSRLGGIAELVRHGVDGLLVEPMSIEAWRQKLEALCEDRGLLKKLREGIRPPRTMEGVAEEMVVLYEKLLGHPR